MIMEGEAAKARINSVLNSKEWQNRDRYTSVFALLLYWENGDQSGFQEEAKTLGEVFSTIFRFHVDFYAIPSEQSHVRLDTRINLLLTEHGKPNHLLIVYYGGHGDPNNNDGEESLAVWAALASGGPTVNWSIIQPKFGEVQSDVLLLFDCCFAAQAARAPLNRAIPANLELLAACAMGVKTILPGPRSFTTNLIKQIKMSVEGTGSARVSDISNMLAERDSGYEYTPAHFSGFGEGKSTIRLEPLNVHGDEDSHDTQEEAWMTLRVSLGDMLTESLISDIINWLKASPKRKVSSLTVENVVISARHVHQFVSGEEGGHSPAPRFDQLTRSAKEDVLSGWMQFRALFLNLATKLGHPSAENEVTTSQETFVVDQSDIETGGLSTTLLELENSLLFLQSVVQRSIMALPDLLKNREVLIEAVDDTIMQDLGIAPLLQRRLDASFPSNLGNAMRIDLNVKVSNPSPAMFRRLFQDRLEGIGSALVEYKYYKAGRPVELLGERVSVLASLLQSHGPGDFRTLSCLKWFHEPDESRFGLVFQFPANCGDFQSLRDVIKRNDYRQRPTLGQRFLVAKSIGEALFKWHISANWVHQDIASHNIYFFRPSGSLQFDFSSPALCGFEFSRPSDKISSNDYFENFALDIYRHPSRQGDPDENHTKQHDLYSFGILLLELGTWRLMEDYFDEGKRKSMGKNKTRQYIEQIARRSLAHSMGEAYERATLTCLQGDFGVQLDDTVGSALARAFQTLVLQKIDT